MTLTGTPELINLNCTSYVMDFYKFLGSASGKESSQVSDGFSTFIILFCCTGDDYVAWGKWLFRNLSNRWQIHRFLFCSAGLNFDCTMRNNSLPEALPQNCNAFKVKVMRSKFTCLYLLSRTYTNFFLKKIWKTPILFCGAWLGLLVTSPLVFNKKLGAHF